MQDDRKVAALLRFHYKTDPEALDDTAALALWYDYLYVRQVERDLHLGIFRQVLLEAGLLKAA